VLHPCSLRSTNPYFRSPFLGSVWKAYSPPLPSHNGTPGDDVGRWGCRDGSCTHCTRRVKRASYDPSIAPASRGTERKADAEKSRGDLCGSVYFRWRFREWCAIGEGWCGRAIGKESFQSFTAWDERPVSCCWTTQGSWFVSIDGCVVTCLWPRVCCQRLTQNANRPQLSGHSGRRPHLLFVVLVERLLYYVKCSYEVRDLDTT
jgi:hypothetical protein